MDTEKKALRYVRVTAWSAVAILALHLILSALLVPKALSVLRRAEDTLTGIDALAQTADEALRSANAAAVTADRLVADNADAVAEAMEKFNSVDFESLNRAIGDLADIVEPLARVSNFFN